MLHPTIANVGNFLYLCHQIATIKNNEEDINICMYALPDSCSNGSACRWLWRDSYPVVIHIYGSAWFNNNGKGMADLGTIVKSLLDAGYAVVCPNHRSSIDAPWPAQINDIRAVIRFVRGEAKTYKFDTSFNSYCRQCYTRP